MGSAKTNPFKSDTGKKKSGYLGLAAAILEQAANDYIDALQKPDTKENQFKILNLERFFVSAWGQELSFCQGEVIIRECRRIAREKLQESKLQNKCDDLKQK